MIKPWNHVCVALGFALSGYVSVNGISFQDVTPEDWHYSYITDMAEQGYVTGVGDDFFLPDEELSFAAFSVMLSNAFYGNTLAPVLETNVGYWWQPFVFTCFMRNGMTNTAIADTLSASNLPMSQWDSQVLESLSRYDVAQMMYNLMIERQVPLLTEEQLSSLLDELGEAIPSQYQTAVATMFYYGLLSGRGDDGFQGMANLTRAESVVVLSGLTKADFLSLELAEDYVPPVPEPEEEEIPEEEEEPDGNTNYVPPIIPTPSLVWPAIVPVEETLSPVMVNTILGSSAPSAYLYNDGIYVKNSSGLTMTVSDLTALSEVQLQLGITEPQILIYHTHGTEAFAPTASYSYLASGSYRSEDETKNIVAVGAAMAEVFRVAGFTVIHDTTQYDAGGNYNISYDRSKVGLLSYIEENPSLVLILDVHRDGLASGDTPIQLQSRQWGQIYSQVMLFVGSDGNQSEAYPHPNWKENLALALSIQRGLLEYGDFPRPIQVAKSRYNQAEHTGALLLEVGNHGNTLAQAVAAGQLFARSASSTLTGLTVEQLFGN